MLKPLSESVAVQTYDRSSIEPEDLSSIVNEALKLDSKLHVPTYARAVREGYAWVMSDPTTYQQRPFPEEQLAWARISAVYGMGYAKGLALALEQLQEQAPSAEIYIAGRLGPTIPPIPRSHS